MSLLTPFIIVWLSCIGAIKTTHFELSQRRTVYSYRFLPKRYCSEGNIEVEVSSKNKIKFPKFIPKFNFNESSMQWALNYADLSPYTEKDFVGAAFLSTNILFFLAGMTVYFDSTRITSDGNPFPLIYSFALDIAGFASSFYHYNQLHYGKNSLKVINALLLDYMVAIISIISFFVDVFIMHSFANSLESIIFSVVAVLCLFACWIFEYGLPYMIFHGLWHIFCSIAVIKLHTS